MGRAASPRTHHPGEQAAPRPSSSKGGSSGEKKVRKKKSTPPVAPLSLGMPMVQNMDELPAEQARQQLGELQKKYGALIVNFNNQQAELAASLKRVNSLENEVVALKEQLGGSGDQQIASLQRQLQDSVQARRRRARAASTPRPPRLPPTPPPPRRILSPSRLPLAGRLAVPPHPRRLRRRSCARSRR